MSAQMIAADLPVGAVGSPLLEIEALTVSFRTGLGDVPAVRGIAMAIGVGETVALVGESGSGKSAAALGMLGLFTKGSVAVDASSVVFQGQSVRPAGGRGLAAALGDRIGVVFQDPQSSLNPTMRVGRQIGETLRVHRRMARSVVDAAVLSALTEVGIVDPARCAQSFPHQLSGGMRQRVMIAMAMIGNPALLVADEPTTALDVTIQAQIVELLIELQRRHGSGILFITHDLSLVSGFADRIMVMYAGEIVETGKAADVIGSPQHPYTKALMAAVPRIEGGDLPVIPGRPPDPRQRPTGCPFHPRCPVAQARCRDHAPPMTRLPDGHESRCWLAADLVKELAVIS